MQENVRRLLEGLCLDDLDIIRPNLIALLNRQDEDILVIILRESVAAKQLVLGSKTATIVGGIIIDAEPKRSLLAKFAKELNDSSMSDCYLAWVDGVLAENIGLESEKWAKEWSKLEAVKEIRRIFSRVEGGEKYGKQLS